MSFDQLLAGLKAVRVGATWMARCPAHRDRTPSLGIARGRDGALLIHCYAGCPQKAVLGELKNLGLWGAGTGSIGNASLNHVVAAPEQRDMKAAAEAIWRVSRPAPGTLVEVYLASRSITLSPPPALRFHPALRHPSGAAWPAMVAIVTDGVGEEPLGIHRTFLARDGQGKAPVQPTKMMLGPCRGGAVRLAEVSDLVMIGEGIESVLSAMQATGKPAWAGLSTSGVRALDLPETIDEVTLLADGDAPGEAAAQHAARRWTRVGRCLRIARPPKGMDFNDLLLATAPPDRRVA